MYENDFTNLGHYTKNYNPFSCPMDWYFMSERCGVHMDSIYVYVVAEDPDFWLVFKALSRLPDL